MKKLFGGLAKNFWFGVEEGVYLEASALGSAVVIIKKYRRSGWHELTAITGIDVSSFRRYVS